MDSVRAQTMRKGEANMNRRAKCFAQTKFQDDQDAPSSRIFKFDDSTAFVIGGFVATRGLPEAEGEEDEAAGAPVNARFCMFPLVLPIGRACAFLFANSLL